MGRRYFFHDDSEQKVRKTESISCMNFKICEHVRLVGVYYKSLLIIPLHYPYLSVLLINLVR